MNETIVASTTRTFNGDSVSPILIYRRLQGKQKFFMESSRRLTTEIEGILKGQMQPLEALSILVPPAASSGVLKRTAAAIVHKIEQFPRSFSGGVIGFVSLNGNINFTILQQAMVIKQQRAYIQAGANILMDTLELDANLEIRKKLKAFLNIEV